MPLTTYTAGQVLTAASLNANFSFVANNQVAVFNETQSSGTQGGASVTGSFLKRVLNTTVTNGITGCTLTSSVISLPAGSYVFYGVAPFIGTNDVQLRLQNTTASTTIGIGSNAVAASATNVTSSITILSFVTLTTTSNIELQYQCTNAKATNGLGNATGFGNEVYSQIQITKVA